MADDRQHLAVPGMSDETSPLLSHQGDDEVEPKHSYGTVIAVAMLLNYIIGTGCFSLPYAFVQAGLVLTGGLIIGGAIVAIIGGIYTLNVLARGNGIRTVGPGEEPYNHIGNVKLDFPDVSGIFYGEGLRKTTQVSGETRIFLVVTHRDGFWLRRLPQRNACLSLVNLLARFCLQP